MTQFRTTEFQNLIESYPLNRARVALFPKGRYHGFDRIARRAGVPTVPTSILIDLNHSGSPFYPVLETNTPGPATGVVVAPVGALLMSDDAYQFEIDENTDGQGRTRYDTIYVSYSWEQIEDGAPFSVEMIKGSPGSVFPAVSDPNTDLIVGVISVPSLPTGTLTFEDLTYTETVIPGVGYQDPNNYVPDSGGTFNGPITMQDMLTLYGYFKTYPDTAVIDGTIIQCNDNGFYHVVDLNNMATVLDQVQHNTDEITLGTVLWIKFNNVGAGSYLKNQYPATINCIVNPSTTHLYLESGCIVGFIKTNSATANHVWQVLTIMKKDFVHNFYNITPTAAWTQDFPRAAASVNTQNNTVILKGHLSKASPSTVTGIAIQVGELPNANLYPQYPIFFPVPVNESGDMGTIEILANGTINLYATGSYQMTITMVSFDGISYQTKEW